MTDDNEAVVQSYGYSAFGKILYQDGVKSLILNAFDISGML
jgi:hypothetical protein